MAPAGVQGQCTGRNRVAMHSDEAYISFSHICTAVTRTTESEQFSDAEGCGWEGCIFVENFELHCASQQEFFINCPTSYICRTGTRDGCAKNLYL